MIPEWIEKIKSYQNEIFLLLASVLTVTLVVGASRLYLAQGSAPSVRYQDKAFELPNQASSTLAGGIQKLLFVASKNGTKYYPVGCKAANRIKEENKIFFATEEDGMKAGFSKTVQCP